MNDIRLVVTDIDGTLVPNHGHEPSPAVHEAIRRLQSAGVHVAIASARPAGYAQDLVSAAGLHGPQVIDGGATIYDFDSGEALSKKWFDVARLRKIVATLQQHALVIDAFPDFKVVPIEVFSIDSIVEPAPYVYAKIRESSHDEVWQALMPIAGIDFQVVAVEPGYEHVQVCDQAATKQHGVERLQRLLGVSAAQTLAIGDADNDLALFAAADERVAMGNATATVKQAATYITDSVDDDGWVSAMKHFGL